MTENQKLREALRETLLFCETFSNRWDGETGAHPFGMVERARQALATTEPAAATPSGNCGNHSPRFEGVAP